MEQSQDFQTRLLVYSTLLAPYLVFTVLPGKKRHFSQASVCIALTICIVIVLMLINSLHEGPISQMNIFYYVTFHSCYFANIQVVSINFTYILFRFENILRFIARMILSSHDDSPNFSKPVFCSAKFPGLQAVFSRANKIYLILQIRRINFSVDF